VKKEGQYMKNRAPLCGSAVIAWTALAGCAGGGGTAASDARLEEGGGPAGPGSAVVVGGDTDVGASGGPGGSTGSGGAPGTDEHGDTDCAAVDPDATAETCRLLEALRATMDGPTLMGQENALHEGVFQATLPVDGVNSDMRQLCGRGAAVVGFDVASVVGDWWEGDPSQSDYTADFQDEYLAHMKGLFARGGVATMAWHANFPGTSLSAWDGPRELWRLLPASACAELTSGGLALPGCGDANAAFEGKLAMLADFFARLKTDDGTPIPVLLRPFHENSGGWFWWGKDGIDDAVYGPVFHALWQYTVDYFRTQGIHQLLWVISPAAWGEGGLTEAAYRACTPGMELVDVLGVDRYAPDQATSVAELRMLVELAEAHGKVAAFTEGGPNVPGDRSAWHSDEWTGYQIGPVVDDPVAGRIAYFMTWYNRPGSNQYWGPHVGHTSSSDFQTLCASNGVALEGDVTLYE
jgi:mannan endo-1,4-beta-mannosidase